MNTFGDPWIVGAALDRVVHDAHHIIPKAKVDAEGALALDEDEPTDSA